MIDEQGSLLLDAEDICQQRTTSEWISYKFFTAQSGILSILGSSLIIFMVFRSGRDGLAKFQNRLLLPMSVFDIIGSIAWAFSTTPIPNGSICTYGALGNEATCTAQGFMITLGMVVPMYNAILCIYYLLVVKYNVRDETIAKYEPLMHFIAICPPLTASIVATANDLFNNLFMLCWLKDRDFFNLQTSNESDFKGVNPIISAICTVMFIFALLILLTIGYCMNSIYRFVKQQELKMSTYQFQRPHDGNSSTSTGNSIRPRSSRLTSTVIDTKKQAFLYVGSFILTYSFSSVCLTFEFFKLEIPFVIMLLQGILSPLQGFWNFLAYIRPRFNIISRQHNEKSIFSRLYIAILKKPEPSRRTRGRGGRRRRRRRLPEQTSSRPLIVSGNNAATARTSQLNDPKNLVVSCKRKIKNDRPKRPLLSLIQEESEQPQAASSIDMQQPHFVPDESPLIDSHIVHDVEKQPGQNLDNLFVASNDCREAVTLSLLVAEDILPQSLHRNRNERKRRVSMVDRFPINLNEDENNRSSQATYLEVRENVLSNENAIIHQKRRHSCSEISYWNNTTRASNDGDN